MRCRQEIAAIEALLRAGHPDVEGLCLGLMDWSWELRRLQALPGLASATPQVAHVHPCGDGWTCSTSVTEQPPCGQESGTEAGKPAAAESRAGGRGRIDATG